MGIDSWAKPIPISYSFTRTVIVPDTSSFTAGRFELFFYVPKGYSVNTSGAGVSMIEQDLSQVDRKRRKSYPVILNFHGGGFTIGKATDDKRWITYVMQTLKDVVVVSVEYRLAPEFPFPVGVQDGVAALSYLNENKIELNLDMNKVVMNGFSCGGNFAFTVSLMWGVLEEEKVREEEKEEKYRKQEQKVKDEFKIIAVTAFYPPTDFTKGREARRKSNPSQSHELPASLTDLFDASYLYPPDLNLSDPFISPAMAEDQLLVKHLPNDIVIYTCEFDGLQEEGERFAKKLEKLGKNIRFRKILGVRHAWDKMPNVGWEKEGVRGVYKEVLDVVEGVLGREEDKNEHD